MLFTKLARFCPSIQNTSRNVLSNSLKEPKNINVFQLMLLKRFMTSATTSTRVWTDAAKDQMNQQILAELKAGYSYLAMSQYFSRNDVNLPNIAKFFKKSSDEEMGHAQSFIDYQNKRGGTCTFFNIPVRLSDINNSFFNICIQHSNAFLRPMRFWGGAEVGGRSLRWASEDTRLRSERPWAARLHSERVPPRAGGVDQRVEGLHRQPQVRGHQPGHVPLRQELSTWKLTNCDQLCLTVFNTTM